MCLDITTVDNFDCPVNAKDEVIDAKERAVALGKAPEILRIKKTVITKIQHHASMHLMQYTIVTAGLANILLWGKLSKALEK